MLLLATITIVVFVLGYWSASKRMAQLGGATLSSYNKVVLGVFGLIWGALAAFLFTIPGFGVIFAELLVLCVGQAVGFILSGKKP